MREKCEASSVPCPSSQSPVGTGLAVEVVAVATVVVTELALMYGLVELENKVPLTQKGVSVAKLGPTPLPVPVPVPVLVPTPLEVVPDAREVDDESREEVWLARERSVLEALTGTTVIVWTTTVGLMMAVLNVLGAAAARAAMVDTKILLVYISSQSMICFKIRKQRIFVNSGVSLILLRSLFRWRRAAA